MSSKRVVEVGHPLALHKLTQLRDKTTGPERFRRLMREIGMLLAYEATRDLPLADRKIETPVEAMRAPTLANDSICIAPVLRAGLGLADGMLDVVPEARVAHVGLFRDPDTLDAVEYYAKAPERVAEGVAIVVDPMLATGGSAIAAVQRIKAMGAASVRYAALLAAPEGIQRFHDAHPDTPVYVVAIDARLNEKSYIVPGLGDAGDRLYGTE